jgi:hypothetical protein
MFTSRKRTLWTVTVAALALAMLGAWLFSAATISASSSEPDALGREAGPPGPFGDGGPGGRIDRAAFLAEALGIDVEELHEAREAARRAAIQLALEQGLITEEQANRMLILGGPVRHGRGRGSSIDETALLADALGITVEALEEAQEAAFEAGVEEAVEEGLITEEQAEEMLRRRALRDYLNPEALLAEALDITVDELRAAREGDGSLTGLLEEQGLDAVEVRERVLEAYDETLDEAVEDGVITEEEAEELQDRRFFGSRRRHRRGPRGRRGRRGRGVGNLFRSEGEGGPSVPSDFTQ